MRILIVARAYPPDRGASARSAAAAADALSAAGHDVVVVAPEADGPSGRRRAAAVRVVRAGEYPPVLAGVDDAARHLQVNIAMFERAAIEVNAALPDVVHAFGDSVAHCAVSLRRAFGLPLIASPVATRDPMADATGRWLAGEADRVIVGSHGAADRLRTAGAPAARIRIVRAGAGHATRLEQIYRETIREREPLHAVTERV